MFPPRGIPDDVTDETLQRVARSFYVVRMLRYALLLVSLGVILALTLAADAPTAVAVVIGVGLLGLVVVALRTHRTYLRSRPSASRASGSPTAG